MLPKAKQKLTRKQLTGVRALCTTATLRAAAQALRMSEKTLWRWMQLPQFAEALRCAKRAALDEAILELQWQSLRAVRRLSANLEAESLSEKELSNVFASNQAANLILGHGLRARELDFEERLRRLEMWGDEQASFVKRDLTSR